MTRPYSFSHYASWQIQRLLIPCRFISTAVRELPKVLPKSIYAQLTPSCRVPALLLRRRRVDGAQVEKGPSEGMGGPLLEP